MTKNPKKFSDFLATSQVDPSPKTEVPIDSIVRLVDRCLYGVVIVVCVLLISMVLFNN